MADELGEMEPVEEERQIVSPIEGASDYGYVRRTSRERKPTRVFTYPSLGQPSYELPIELLPT